MIRSMTAFARQQTQHDWGSVTWELRSVNHRYLEVSVRLPETLRILELAVREQVNQQLGRGKVECGLKLQVEEGTLTSLNLNRPLAQRVLEVASELEHMMGPGTGLAPIDVLRWPGVVSEPEPDLDALKDTILDTLNKTLTELVATREREGQRIETMLLPRCDGIISQVQKVRERRPEVLSRLREKLLKRLQDLPAEADPGRLEQEMVIVAQRLDIDEELDRLDAHTAEICDVLKRDEPVGRRLDFLMQELNREANTLGSKAADTETIRCSTEIKVFIEQMREQIQNIE